MECPRCHGKMLVTNSYRVGVKGSTHKYQCQNLKCGLIATAITIPIFLSPNHGQGASSVAEKLRKSTSVEVAIQ